MGVEDPKRLLTPSATLSARALAAGVVLVSAAGSARGQTYAQVLDGLERTKAKVLAGQACAQVRFSLTGPIQPEDADSRRVSAREPVVWAYQGEKMYFGQRSAARGWDGGRMRYRADNPGGQADAHFTQEQIPSVGPGLDDPIHAGYQVDWPRRAGLWLCDLARLQTPEFAVLPNGMVRLTWNYSGEGAKIRFVFLLDPKRDFMIESVERRDWSFRSPAAGAGGFGASGGTPVPSQGEGGSAVRESKPEPFVGFCRVLEAKRALYVWVPTHIVWGVRGLDTGKSKVSREWVSTNVRAFFDDQIFRVFQPGDTVRDDLKLYRFTETGDFEPLPDPKPWSETSAEQDRKEFFVLVGAAAALIFAGWFVLGLVQRQQRVR